MCESEENVEITQKTTLFCDACGTQFERTMPFYSSEYGFDINLCYYCVKKRIENDLKTLHLMKYCSRCQGTGIVEDRRIQEVCWQNEKKCPDCGWWW